MDQNGSDTQDTNVSNAQLDEVITRCVQNLKEKEQGLSPDLCKAANTGKYPEPTTKQVIPFLGKMENGVNYCNKLFIFDIPIISSFF